MKLSDGTLDWFEAIPVDSLRAWFDTLVEGQPNVPLCANHAEQWFCERNHMPNPNDECVVCAYKINPVATPQPAGEAELRECNKCGGRDLGVVWHKGHANSVFSWENSGCNASVDHKGIDPYTEHLYKFCRTCQYSWREALAATAKEGGG